MRRSATTATPVASAAAPNPATHISFPAPVWARLDCAAGAELFEGVEVWEAVPDPFVPLWLWEPEVPDAPPLLFMVLPLAAAPALP